MPRGSADVGVSRERQRRRRLWRLALALAVPSGFLWYRLLDGRPFDPFRLPQVDWLLVTPLLFFVLLAVVLLGSTVGAGRSPHVTYRPEQIDVRLSDVVGLDAVKEDALRSLDLFLAHRSFTSATGGTPRRGVLFEGPPGTGKTHLAKALAAEAGVPFLFVSATAFQSMFYGATARKIRSYFRALRRAAYQEGGAIGFIEEIDAIATSRRGLAATSLPPVLTGVGLPRCVALAGLPPAYALPWANAQSPAYADGPAGRHPSVVSEGVGGVVNELLVQLQSFDQPTGAQRAQAWCVDKANLLLPAHRQLRRPRPSRANVLLVAATNRAADLDPALLRPGRFDRRLTFDPPAQAARRALVDHFLARKAHEPDLATDARRDQLAAVTQGYTPVMIEHLLDEALVNALRRGATAMSWADLERARLTEEVGLGQPVGYTAHERALIATHEAGHAVVAWLVAPQRRLEVLTIVKRREALGLLAHGDRDEVFTRSRAELAALIRIALAGQCAEDVFFGDVSTGPGGDLLYATNVAAQMVGACGMAGTLVSYAAVQHSALADTNIVGRVLGDPTGRAQVEELLQEQQAAARALVTGSRHLVAALRDALLAREELVGEEITAVLEAAQAVGPEVTSGAAPPVGPPPEVVDLRDPQPDPRPGPRARAVRPAGEVPDAP